MIYILDGAGQPVGPFKDREHVERFIRMMALCGEQWADNSIVELSEDDAPGLEAALMNSQAIRLKRDSKLKLVPKGR